MLMKQLGNKNENIICLNHWLKFIFNFSIYTEIYTEINNLFDLNRYVFAICVFSKKSKIIAYDFTIFHKFLWKFTLNFVLSFCIFLSHKKNIFC